MANTPKPQSQEQLIADMLSAYATKLGIDDFNVGSAVTSFFEVVGLTTARASGDVFQILRDYSVDRASGDALKRLAAENRVKLITAKPSTGLVSVTDSSFEKKSTKIYAGASSPNIGATVIKVSDASVFPASGSIYIGRGTPNIEGPIAYSSITTVGGYYEINLNTSTTKFHNIGETVVLAQGGNRSIPANTIVLSPSAGASPDIQFTVTIAAFILDGEVTVDSVQVSAQTPGASSNIPRGAVKQFANAPFSGATVTNILPFTAGKDSETDDQLRVRIKRQLASRGLGTATAIKSSVIGATPSDENATIVSSEITNSSIGSTVYIDNGDGYEAKSLGVGKESIVDSALGGEQFFQLATGGRQAPVAKAFLQSTLAAPFDIVGGDTLEVTVGEQTFQHVFANTDFRSPGGVTAFEITASVNANTALGFEASTSDGGQYVVFRAKVEGTNDTMKVATPITNGRDAVVQLGLPSNQIQTLRLYKNKLPLSQYGNSASVFTQAQSLWSATIANGETFGIAVDGTSNINYTITDADFIATGLYTTVGSTNSLESWAQVLNKKLTGVTVVVVGQQLKITSNLGAANRASIVIDPSSTLVTKGIFNSELGLISQGKASDFKLSRNTAQFELTEPLIAGDELTGGSDETEARLESAQIPGGSITFASDAHAWILIDAAGEIIPNGVAGNTVLAVSKPATNTIRYTSDVAQAFQNVFVGDYMIVWSLEIDASVRLEGRVSAKAANYVEIVVTPAEYAAAITTTGIFFSEGFVFLRSEFVPQKLRVQTGTKTLDQISLELQSQTNSLIFSVQEEQYIVVRSRTKETDGSLLIVTADAQGKLLNLPANSSDSSKDSLIAFYDSGSIEAELPLFIHAVFASGTSANPIDSYIASVVSSISLAGRDPNELIALLHPYGAVRDAQAFNEHVQQTSISGTTVGVATQNNLRRVRSIDRYFLANPLDFGPSDTAVVVLDNDTSSKSFEMQFYRRGITNTSNVNNPNTFNAYDVDSGATTNFQSAFGSTFDFNNFKVLMHARKVIKAIGVAKTAILYRSAKWGRSGEKVNVGYSYPSVANAAINSTVEVTGTVDIRINLKGGAAIATALDASTEWNVTITPNTPSAGIDQVTYSYSGTGTPPAFTLSGGEYVNIGDTTELSKANTGIFRISTQASFAPSASSFTVQRPSGVADAENDRATIVATAIQFYNSAPTTAAEIKAYVDASLVDYLTATLTNDGGTDGSGVIALSTYEDSGFTAESYYLFDGINWIASTNLGGSPQFSFKKPLALSADIGYTFNNGEEIRLVPTTMDQVRRLLSVLAVTGIRTVGTVGVVERGNRLELATDVLGSSGAIQVIGGIANQYQVPVLDSAIRVNNQLMIVSADKVASQGVNSDQWFRLQASFVQRKDMLLSSNSSVTVIGNNPSNGQSTIKLLGRAMNQRYFGKPRSQTRVRGRTFRVEKQGSLVCLSWNQQSASPAFLKAAANFNATSGTINVSKVVGTSESEYRIMSGAARFGEMSIGDLFTISGLFAENNGTFPVTGVSDDGKTIRVLNPDAVNELSKGSFNLTTNSTAGDAFTVDITTLVAGTDFTIGVTAAETATNFSAVAGTISGITTSVVGSTVTVTSTIPNETVALSYSGVGTVVVTQMVGEAYNSSTFSASLEVSEGDTMTLSAPFAALNQGRYRVIRRFNDSVWFENANVVEEEVTLPNNYIALGFDVTTSFKANATNGSLYLNWNGSGTEPQLENARMGDTMTFGSDFASGNQGEFMVLRSGVKLQQVTQFTMPAGTQFTASGAGDYFVIYSAGNITQHAVWFNVNGGNFAPTVPGATLHQVNILNGDSSTLVAAKASAVIDPTVDFSSVAAGDVLTVTTAGFQETTSASNVTMPAPFIANVNQAGRRTFVESINPSAVDESAVFVSGTLTCNFPQITFAEYEATVAGDQFVTTGETLLTSNAGAYTITDVIDRETAIVSGSLAPVSNASLNGRETSVYLQEGVAYTGYKHILLFSVQPGAPRRSYIVFDTNKQYEKINQSAGVQLTSLSKLNFATVIRKGLDSYRYNTGLIAEANRIIYGDPRDEETYPGVGAAGAEIFVREPLTRRIQVGIDIRIATGVPFAQIAEQVRTSVSSLINSNGVGQSIAISAIISVVNGIPGARAVAISSPQYDSTNDIIFLAPSEKARIIDPVLDISVSQIGS